MVTTYMCGLVEKKTKSCLCHRDRRFNVVVDTGVQGRRLVAQFYTVSKGICSASLGSGAARRISGREAS
jgi:hypothetical protein